MYLPISFLAGITLFGLIFLIISNTNFFSRKNADKDNQKIAEHIVSIAKHIAVNMTISGTFGIVLTNLAPQEQWLCVVSAACISLYSIVIMSLKKEKGRDIKSPASLIS